MILLDLLAMRDLLVERRPVPQHRPEDVFVHHDRAPGHDVFERRHALESAPRSGRCGRCPGARRGAGACRAATLPRKTIGAFLGRVEAVDDVSASTSCRRRWGPMMARISPFLTSKEMSVMAFTPPNRSETFFTSHQGVAPGDAVIGEEVAMASGCAAAFIRRPP